MILKSPSTVHLIPSVLPPALRFYEFICLEELGSLFPGLPLTEAGQVCMGLCVRVFGNGEGE